MTTPKTVPAKDANAKEGAKEGKTPKTPTVEQRLDALENAVYGDNVRPAVTSEEDTEAS